MFRVFVDSPRYFKQVITEIEELDQFSLFNTDIPIAQIFFYDYDLFPMGFCEFELTNYSPSVSPGVLSRIKKKRPIIQKIVLKDSNEEIFYKLPPLRIKMIDLFVSFLQIGIHAQNEQRQVWGQKGIIKFYRFFVMLE